MSQRLRYGLLRLLQAIERGGWNLETTAERSDGFWNQAFPDPQTYRFISYA